MDVFSDGSSTLPASTRWTLHEHLLFQRRLCRKGVAVMSTQNPRVKVLMCLGPRVFYILVPDWDSAPNHNRQTAASNASVNTHSPFLLVGDYAPNPTEHRTHSVAAHCTRTGCIFCPTHNGVMRRLIPNPHLNPSCSH